MSTDACSNVFAGLDWAVHTHAVCVIDTAGAVLDRFEIAHDREGLAELMRRLARFGARVRIAIERPSGLIVDALVEAGHHVFPIHPNAVKASRPRYRSHGAKSDASDAYLLADLLRTDGHRWRELSPQSDSIRALRALVRSRDDLVAARVALGNQLQSTLQAFWPGAACIFADITSPIGLAFLNRYPSPTSAARLNQAALGRFCRGQHYSGRRSPAELLARLHSAAAGLGGPLTNEAAGQLVRSMVAVLQPLVAQIAALTQRIERFIESLPDGQIIMSFPRAGHVCAAQILAELGDVRERLEIAHDAAGLSELKRRLKHWGSPPSAIERPSGLVVDTLMEAGFTVVPIHPNAVKATRPRYRSHAAKSDASDAYLLADLLRTDGHRFKPLAPQGDETRALRALVRGRDDLVATRVQLANQLRSLLESFWPGAAEVFADVDSPIALAFIDRYPTPDSAARLGPKRMAAFCAQHAYCGRRSAEELLARLGQAPAAVCEPLEMDAKGELARCLARTLTRLVEQIRLLSSRIEHHVGSLEDGRILMSFPRAGRICAAQILAELGSVRKRFDSDEHLAAEAGVAPVTYQSGKSKAVTFRWACNHRLRAALTCLADNSRHANAGAADVYAKAKARGCDHPHAIRILSRAWLRVIWRAWTDRKTYDPTQHRAAQTLLKTAGG